MNKQKKTNMNKVQEVKGQVHVLLLYILEIVSNYVKMPYHALIRAFAAVYFSKDFFAILNINIKKFRLLDCNMKISSKSIGRNIKMPYCALIGVFAAV